MTRKFYFLFINCIYLSVLQAQDIYTTGKNAFSSKLVIDSTAVNRWCRLGSDIPLINNNGNYFAYSIFNKPVGKTTLVLKSLKDKREVSWIGATAITFSDDNRQFICSLGDSLFFYDLNNGSIVKKVVCASWKSPGQKGHWLAWQQKENIESLVVRNLITGQEQTYNNVLDYSFSERGNALILKTNMKMGVGTRDELSWINLSTGASSMIWSAFNKNNEGSIIGSYSIDKQGMQLSFTTKDDSIRHDTYTIWYYREGMEKAIIKVSNKSSNVIGDLCIGPSVGWSNNGKYIFFNLVRPSDPRPDDEYVKLDVWSYRDTILQSVQQTEGTGNIFKDNYRASVSNNANVIIPLERSNGDFVECEPDFEGDFVVVGNSTRGDRFWLNEKKPIWLVSLKDGQRKLLPIKGEASFVFSPDGEFLLSYDAGQKNNYFSTNLVTGDQVNISQQVPSGLLSMRSKVDYDSKMSKPLILNKKVGVAGWIADQKAVLVYDEFDIWQLDLKGKKAPINITNGFGRKHQIKFKLINNSADPIFISSSTKVLHLIAFNETNKENGFYTTDLSKKGNPSLSYMGPYAFHLSPFHVNGFPDQGMAPIKSRDSNIWVAKRQNERESPNYFATSDLKKFEAITHIHPEFAYNWIKADLITWNQAPNISARGILYKPENFDPQKKYPVIWILYTDFSGRLHNFTPPDYSEGLVNIPWFVSQGYLVFTPDIYFAKGHIGGAALSTVTAAMNTLSKLTFVDTSKMAVVGHSYSARMSYHVVANSNFFTAAIAGDGHSDMVRSYLDLGNKNNGNKGGMSMRGYEVKLDGSLWEKPDVYFAESPILKADQIRTPLIILHSKIDGIPWEQSIGMYLALRRLERKSWMLQYDDAGHNVSGKDAVDYTIRINQFFNHYLKSTPAPLWMTRGIRFRDRGIVTGYGLDLSGNCGKDCKACKTWNEKWKKDSVSTLKQINGKAKTEHWMGGG